MTVTDRRVAAATLPKDLVENRRLSQWVSVGMDGIVGVRVGKVEFGQGILTALAQIAADELRIPLEHLQMLPPHTTGPDEGLTAGSMSVSEAGPAVRLVCANVRALFVQEAARRWRVSVEDVSVTNGSLFDESAGRRTTYGKLAHLVHLDVDVTTNVTMTTAGAETVGMSVARLDLPGKIAGRPSYISDLRLPDQHFGRVVRPPSPRARLREVDRSAVREMDVQLVQDGSFLGAVGTDEAEVERAAERLRLAASWDEEDGLPDESDLVSFLRAGPCETIPVVDESRPAGPAAKTIRAHYSRPFIAHASIAPSCGIARWEPDGKLSVWSHSQGIHKLRHAIAQALGIDVSTVSVEHAENAGCYGHNAADDAAFDAVLLAKAVPGRPVQVQWSRQDELAWGPFGSAMSVAVEAELTGSGRPLSWTYDVWSQGHTARPGYAGVAGLLAGAHLSRPLSLPAAIDPPLASGGGSTRNATPIYDVGCRRITGHRLLETPIRSSALRALGAFMNVFAIESFMDELAAHSHQDPLTYRLTYLSDERGRSVLEAAAAAAGWGGSTPDAVGLGIGLARYKDHGAYCAVIAEVAAEHDVKVRKLTIAVDVGRTVNPDGVRNQIEGGATQAMSWTLKERVRFDRRRVTSTDWESYPILRFSEVPEIDVHLLDRPDLPSVGAGEAAQGPTAAAIANAAAAAVGVRVRDLPLTTEAVVEAIESQQ